MYPRNIALTQLLITPRSSDHTGNIKSLWYSAIVNNITRPSSMTMGDKNISYEVPLSPIPLVRRFLLLYGSYRKRCYTLHQDEIIYYCHRILLFDGNNKEALKEVLHATIRGEHLGEAGALGLLLDGGFWRREWGEADIEESILVFYRNRRLRHSRNYSLGIRRLVF